MLRPLRLLLSFALVLLAASVFTASAPADDDDDDDRPRAPRLIDFTTGTGTADFGTPIQSTFRFDVRSGPGGEAATGFAFLTSAGGLPFSGNATCLRVFESRAVFEIDNTDPTTAALFGDVVVFVGDFGTFGVGAGFDEFNFDLIPLPAQADAVCEQAPRERDRSVRSGDIVVGDNVPAPRSGDDDEDEGEDDEDNEDDDD